MTWLDRLDARSSQWRPYLLLVLAQTLAAILIAVKISVSIAVANALRGLAAIAFVAGMMWVVRQLRFLTLLRRQR